MPVPVRLTAKKLYLGVVSFNTELLTQVKTMDETILVPSPNWFHVAGLAVSNDGWIIYGGPTRSLCVLVPLPAKSDNAESPSYCALVLNKVHMERIVCVDISREWPEKRLVLTGSSDGSVKQWNLDDLQKVKNVPPPLTHDVHINNKEEVSGLGYSNEGFAITAGSFGNLVKWDLKSNVVKSYPQLSCFKPTCLACSPHITLQVAVGTKQGVVFVLDLNDAKGNILYKVRGQDEEVLNLSWCPQFEVTLKKALEPRKKTQGKPLKDKEAVAAAVADTPGFKTDTVVVNTSGTEKDLPDDSFSSVCSEPEKPEDDMFDIYTDHAADEFGHRKYQPEDIIVKVAKETQQDDYLADCLKLKEEILKRKALAESSINSLVEALDKTHVDDNETHGDGGNDQGSSASSSVQKKDQANKQNFEEAATRVFKHLLATISKNGSVRIWSKGGKLVSSCTVSTNKTLRNNIPVWPTLLWYKPNVLLLADLKNQLLACNPLKSDCQNKLEWHEVHNLHKRNIYCIASNAPRVQDSNESDNDWKIWTVSQDRNIIQYSLSQRKKISILNSCGGFVYTVAPCPYDASKIAVSVGDGAVRVIHCNTTENDELSFNNSQTVSFWQNVQGKVLVVAWHPTRENLLAFATAESRIGLIDTSIRHEKPAKVFPTAHRGGVYSISWGDASELYAAGGGELVVFNTRKQHDMPVTLPVVVEGCKWKVASVRYTSRALLVGSEDGAVACLEPHTPHAVMAAILVFSKMIYMTEWHPQQTTNSNEESPYKNLIAVCSQDKISTISILEFIEKEDGSKQLQVWKTLSGHKLPVLQLAWSPHNDGQLLSTSQDGTARVWSIGSGECLSVFEGHGAAALGAAWAQQPRSAALLLSGGGDCALRAWRHTDHPAHLHDETTHEVPVKKEKKLRQKRFVAQAEETENIERNEEQMAAAAEYKWNRPRKFLLPTLFKQTGTHCRVAAARMMFNKYLEKNAPERLGEFPAVDESEYDLDFVKMFGTINEVNELLDEESGVHKTAKGIENWIMLSIFRGHIDTMIQFATKRHFLCPFLVSMAPCVSFKYWKDVSQLYLAQIDRFVAKGEEDKLWESRYYGGGVYRKAATQLSLHDVKGAVNTLVEAEMFMEAYILCRTRYMDSIAVETLELWAKYCYNIGVYLMAAVCYIALGDLGQAANALGKLMDEDSLLLAADVAKVNGQNMLVDRITEKRENIISNSESLEKTEELLKELPSRIEALLAENKVQNGEAN